MPTRPTGAPPHRHRDEVYHLAFDRRRHVPIATLPGMAERTVAIGSDGKKFSASGGNV